MHIHTLLRSLHRARPLLMPVLIYLVIGLAPAWSQATSAQTNKVSIKQTMKAYESIPGLTSAEVGYGKTAISGMHYNAQRIFRKMCVLPGINFHYARQVIELLGQERISYEHVLTFEALAGVSGMNIELGIAGLSDIKGLTFEGGRAFRNFSSVPGTSASQATNSVSAFASMPDVNNRAAQAVFLVKGMGAESAQRALAALVRLHNNQAKAAESFAEMPSVSPDVVLDALELLARVDQHDAWIARCMFKNREVSPQESWNWLVSYFALPTRAQISQYNGFDTRKKSMLLQALADGASDAIWVVNNLHAVTDQYGYEIPDSELNRWSKGQLQSKFNQLPASVRARYPGFAAAGRAQAVGLLKQATSAARVQSARDLTLPSLYATMAYGSELYDSSFRNIMVPILKGRIDDQYGGNLLSFFQDIDPGNRLVADFISTCAQKGKLTTFFPAETSRQKVILDLVAASAFRDGDSVLLFSATFSYLLKSLTPEARSHLIGLMARKSEAGQGTSSMLVNVILQYYLQTFPGLLGKDDRVLISSLIVRHGQIDLSRYQATPFREWKQDGRLGSVSMYHPDDDGRQSFVSNANLLLNSGYRMVVSERYTIPQMTPTLRQQIQQWMGSGLTGLFQAMRRHAIAVEFTKSVGDVTIVHAQFVYSDMNNQMEMLKRFILSGDEMLAQRGHSYWRSEQIVEPLDKLIKEKTITEQHLRNKQRFLSLGSCGGVKVYTQLTRLFASSVDILATIGTGLALINDPYNKRFFEIIASNPPDIVWNDVANQASSIFQGGQGQDYLQPGSLTAMLHKILDEAGATPTRWN